VCRRATQADHCKSARLCRPILPHERFQRKVDAGALIGLHQRRACLCPPKMINVVGRNVRPLQRLRGVINLAKIVTPLLQGQLLRARSSPAPNARYGR